MLLFCLKTPEELKASMVLLMLRKTNNIIEITIKKAIFFLIKTTPMNILCISIFYHVLEICSLEIKSTCFGKCFYNKFANEVFSSFSET